MAVVMVRMTMRVIILKIINKRLVRRMKLAPKPMKSRQNAPMELRMMKTSHVAGEEDVVAGEEGVKLHPNMMKIIKPMVTLSIMEKQAHLTILLKMFQPQNFHLRRHLNSLKMTK